MDTASPPSNSASSTFPNRSPGLCIYLDPTSFRAQELSEQLLVRPARSALRPLQTLLLTSSCPHLVFLQNLSSTSTPLLTTTLSEATHVVLNPFSTFGQGLIQAQTSSTPVPSSQYILAFRWIEESIRLEQYQPEDPYLYVPITQEGQEEEVSIHVGEGTTDVELELEPLDAAIEELEEVVMATDELGEETEEVEIEDGIEEEEEEDPGTAVDAESEGEDELDELDSVQDDESPSE